MKIAIATPVHGDTKAPFTLSLARMLLATVGEWPRRMPGKSLRLEVLQLQGTAVGIAREHLLREAERIEADWILWLDADQTFPPDTLIRLVKHDLPVVGANYPRRGDMAPPTATIRGEGKTVAVYSTEDKVRDGVLEPVDYIGLGVCLMSIAAVRDLKRPVFHSMAEDAYFFDRLRETGIRPVVDHALSAEVGHIHSIVLTNADSLSVREKTGTMEWPFTVDAQPG
jgi:hypothetical protein